MMFIIALISVSFAADCTGVDFLRGGDTCGGVCNSCAATDYQCLGAVGVGPCDTDNGAVTSRYFLMTGEAIAVVLDDDTSYLTDASKKIVIDDVTDGWAVKDDGTDYSFSNTGIVIGNATMGGGIGFTSYLAKNAISTNTDKVYFKDGEGNLTLSEASCISDIDSNGNCGAAKSYNAGDFKFNTYGWTSGTNFQVPTGAVYLGLRMKVQIVGVTVTNFTVNGGSTVAANGGTDVTSLTVTLAEGVTGTATFTTNYNYGAVNNQTKTADFTGTKNVKIKAHSLNETEQSVLLDYLFDITDLNTADKCFIYDAKITTVGTETAATTTTAAPATTTTAAAAATTASPETTTAAPATTTTAAPSAAAAERPKYASYAL